jgi:RNA polymerase sigma-70 factor (sigma-E family)
VAVDEAGYREYVSYRLDGWRRTAFLLSGDWHTADDLVSTALLRLLRHWRRVSAMEYPDAYVRRMLLRAWLDERRRPWRREHATSVLPERAAPTVDTTNRLAILALLAELPARRRAVLILRYFCDLSVEETADALGCSAGTVKSQTARALDTLRARLVGVPAIEE